MDENFLLTLEILKLSPEVRTGVPVRGVCALKHATTGSYLIVNEAQRLTLEAFRTPQTVPHMLGRAILSRTCLELSEFYELILKAHRAGILTSGAKPAVMPSPKPLARWLKLPWQVSVTVAMLAGLGFLAAIALTRLELPHDVWDYVIGWAAWAVCLSFGYLVGAATLQHAKGRFPAPRFKVFRLVPHVYIDLRDSVLQPTHVRSAIELICIAPLLGTAAVACALQKSWALLPMAGAIVALNPWWGPMSRWRMLHARQPRIDTEHSFLFSANRRPKRRIRAFRRHLDGASLVTLLAMSLVWLAIAGHVIYHALNVPTLDVVLDVRHWEWVGMIAGGVVALFILGVGVWVVSAFTKRRGTRLLTNVVHKSRRWKTHTAGALAQTEVMRAMSRSPLYRSVGMQKQIEISRRFALRQSRPWKPLAAPDLDEPCVGLIVRGTAAVIQRDATGRKRKLRHFVEGDVYGAHTLVDPDKPRIEVKSRTPVLSLTLPPKFFQERVVQPLGANKVHTLTHTCSFLRSLPLCQYWQLASVMRLADLATVRTYEKDDKIIQYADDPRAFFIIWEGSVQMIHHGKVIERLEEGDSFGEAELLQNSAAVADVVATTRTRCLCVPRVDFIRFVTHNHNVAMSLETTSSRRLGRRIFPLQASFDVR